MDWKKKLDRVPGLVITLILLALSVVFMVMCIRTKMIPTNYLLIIGAVLLAFLVLIAFLTWRMKNKIRFTIGALLGVVFVGILALGSLYVNKTQTALTQITGEKTEVTNVCVYVKTDDAADSVDATKGYTYGILQTLDREKTDGALQHLNKEFGSDVETKEYPGLTELVDGLLDGETGAILLNQAYLDVIMDMDGYSDVTSKIKEVGIVEVEKIINEEDNEESSGAAEGDAKAEEAAPEKTANGGKVYTIYISGIDTRGEMTASSRSDVNIIATINTDTHEVLLVSTPRDYYVPLSISNGVPDKLTHAGIYGIDVCMDTLGMLYDEEINYYFRVNFGGFVQIIDALGGVDVYSEYEFDSGNTTGWHFNQGYNHLDGESALVFARERYAFSSGDRQRGKNQMAVIKAVAAKLTSTEILTNYSSILSSLDGCFGTNISYEEIAELLQNQLKNGGSWNVVSYSVDGTGATEKPYSMSQKAYVMVPDYTTVDKAKELMQKVKDGEVLTQEDVDAFAGSQTTEQDTTETTSAETTAAQ